MKKVYFKKDNKAQEVANIFCIGRNYAAHIKELNNKKEDWPLVFLKPTSALNTEPTIRLPAFSKEIDYETELVLLIGKNAKNIQESEALSLIAGYGLGLDLTARDYRRLLKKMACPGL